jgi:hypothetical protein
MRGKRPGHLRVALLGALVLGGVLGHGTVQPSTAPPGKPFEAVVVAADAVDRDAVAGWKKEGFRAVVLMLDDRHPGRAVREAARAVAADSLDLYLWIEVGRTSTVAREHPQWVAALGMHADWRQRFPQVRPPGEGEVAKAWPWVPISYQESFDAHLARIRRLLADAPPEYAGLFLNDLQGGPASCGCGNLQCRWAVDYRVPSTATRLAGVDVAARFVAAVGRATPGKRVIPVWTTECEPEDLPAAARPPGSWGTGYCGDVQCFETCRKRFAEQWAALNKGRDGPTAVLALHREFQRDRKEYGGPASWVTRAVEFCDRQGPRPPVPHRRLWLVVQGYDVPPTEEAAARAAAATAGVGAVLVARSRIDQTYEPRVMKVK